MQIIPPKIEKHFVMISPLVPTNMLATILQSFTNMGATILDV